MNSERISGKWWLPEADDQTVHGTLILEPDEVIRLELDEPLGGTSDDMTGATILGFSSDAQDITAEVAFDIGRGSVTSIAGTVRNQVLLVDRAYVGHAHLPRADSRTFREAYVTPRDTAYWSGFPGPTDDFATKGARIAINLEVADALEADVGAGRVILHPSWGITGDGLTERTLLAGANFICSTDEPLSPVEWLQRFVDPLQDLVTLATQRPQSIESLAFKIEEHEDVRFLFNRVQVRTTEEKPFVHEFLFTATGLGERFGEVLTRWFELYGKAEAAIDLLLSTRYQPSLHVETRFLNTVGAAEALHRRLMPGPLLPEDRHRARLEAILAAAPDEHRGWLKFRLKHSNEPSLHDRLVALLSRADAVLRPWLGEVPAFATKVSRARNALTHQDPDAAAEIPSGADLFGLAEDLHLAITIFLLQELAFDNDHIRKMLEYSRLWRSMAARRGHV